MRCARRSAESALHRGAQQSRAALVRAEEGRRGAADPRRRAQDAPTQRPDAAAHGAHPAAPQRYPGGRAGRRGTLKDEPDNADALTMLGQVLHETDRYEEAIRFSRRRSRASPNNPEALQLLRCRAQVGWPARRSPRTHSQGAEAQRHDVRRLCQSQRSGRIFQGMATSCSTAWRRSSSRRQNPEADQFMPLHFAFAKASTIAASMKRRSSITSSAAR